MNKINKYTLYIKATDAPSKKEAESAIKELLSDIKNVSISTFPGGNVKVSKVTSSTKKGKKK